MKKDVGGQEKRKTDDKESKNFYKIRSEDNKLQKK